MLSDQTKQRISYIFLCATPFVAFGAVLARPLRIPGVYHAIGAVLFVAISAAAWTLGARAIRSDVQNRRQLALAGTLLVAPFAMVALLWVGLGGPWAATAAENQMRYLVLILMAISAAGGFVMLREALNEAGERFYSTLGFAAAIMAGPLYVIWNAFTFGLYVSLERGGEIAPALLPLGPFQNLLLALAVGLTYFAAAAYAVSLARIDLLGRKASLAYLILNIIALSLVVILIVEHPAPSAESVPWYAMPGIILCIPALPLIMPTLLGVVLLRRAGAEQR
ncbi:MAG: hypothetical protein WAL47_04810 [Pyrinomonadaceae bacterium]